MKSIKRKRKHSPDSHTPFDFRRGTKFWDKEFTDNNRSRRLAARQNTIANFVRIMTGKNIPVRFPQNGKHYDSARPSEIFLSTQFGEDQMDVQVGVALHEASHIMYTNFDSVYHPELGSRGREYVNNLCDRIHTSNVMNSFMHSHILRQNPTADIYDIVVSAYHIIANIIEDIRIDNISYKNAIGYRQYYEALNEYLFTKETFQSVMHNCSVKAKNNPNDITIDDYILSLTIANASYFDESVLPGLSSIADKMKSEFIVQNVTSTDGSYKLSRDVLIHIIDHLPKDEKDEDDEGDGDKNQDDDSQKENSGGGNDSESHDDTDNRDSNDSQDKDGDVDEDDYQNDQDDDGGNQDDENESASNDQSSDGTNNNDASDTQDDDELHDINADDINRVISFIRGNTRVDTNNLSLADHKQIDLYTSPEYQQAESQYNGEKVPVDVIYMTKRNRQKFGHDFYFEDVNLWEEQVRRGQILGKRLERFLQIRNDTKITTTPNMKTGAIDKKKLWSLGVENENIFKRVTTEDYTNYNIHVSLDTSGSMRDKMSSAVELLVTLGVAFRNIQGVRLQVSTRTTGRQQHPLPFLAIIYDSEKDTIRDLYSVANVISCGGYTPESLCFTSIESQLNKNKSAGSKNIFINICDGEPYASLLVGNRQIMYDGSSAYEHIKSTIKLLKSKNNIDTITFFVNHRPSVPSRYGHYLEISDQQLQGIAKFLTNQLLTK